MSHRAMILAVLAALLVAVVALMIASVSYIHQYEMENDLAPVMTLAEGLRNLSATRGAPTPDVPTPDWNRLRTQAWLTSTAPSTIPDPTWHAAQTQMWPTAQAWLTATARAR